MLIHVPVSCGELFDKITILEIKMENMTDKAKLANVARELEELCKTRDKAIVIPPTLPPLVTELKAINQKLWGIEDDIRECERQKDFGPKFVELARAVYFTNDDRMRVKRQINDVLGSSLVEEKSYAAY